MSKSLPKLLYDFTSTFEFELLVYLILAQWKHPRSNDLEYRNHMLEQVAEVLRAAVAGEQHLADLPANNMNIVAAMWYVESVNDPKEADYTQSDAAERRRWCDEIKKTLPSCFCPADDLL